MLGIFLDTEANGLNPHKHKILEIAYKILDVKTGILKAEFQSVISQPLNDWEKSDPASLKVNGFTWEIICQGKQSALIAKEIITNFQILKVRRGNAVFICQNPSFDRAYFSQLIDHDIQEALHWPYHWLDLASMYWKSGMLTGEKKPDHFPWKTGFSKDKIAQTYHLSPEVRPHRAMNGVDHLILCYEAVVGFPHSPSTSMKIFK